MFAPRFPDPQRGNPGTYPASFAKLKEPRFRRHRRALSAGAFVFFSLFSGFTLLVFWLLIFSPSLRAAGTLKFWVLAVGEACLSLGAFAYLGKKMFCLVPEPVCT